MKLTTYTDVRDLLRAYVPAAGLAAAMELGLFWRLADQPQSAASLAQSLGIPLDRCRNWLKMLSQLGLLEERDQCFGLTSVARTAIIDARSQETWALLAQFERENYPVGNDLTTNIRQSDSTWTLQGLAYPEYVQQMIESPERARRFTRMLYEIHLDLANELSETLDLTDVRRLMDVGGGSGVISLALLRRYPDLAATVVDIPNVCAAGREIAKENGMAHRITYHPANMLHDALPTGFDMALLCDVVFHDPAVLRKLAGCIKPKGRIVIVGDIPSEGAALSLGYAVYDFKRAMHDAAYSRFTKGQVSANLEQAGFVVDASQALSDGMTLIQAHKDSR